MFNAPRSHRKITNVPGFRVGTLVAALALSSMAGCISMGSLAALLWPASQTPPADLIRFQSADEFKTYVADWLNASRSSNTFNQFDSFLPSLGALPTAAPAAGGTAATDFSTTNIQEAGVDESDKVKTDGVYLFVLGNRSVRIVRAAPADQMQLVATVEVPDSPQAMYLSGDKLIVLSQSAAFYPGYYLDVIAPSADNRPHTTVTLIDVTDRAAPHVTASIKTDGTLFTSRLIESKLHLVLQSQLHRPFTGMPLEDVAVRVAPVEMLIPEVTRTDAAGASTTEKLVQYSDVYRPVDPDGLTLTIIATLDIGDPNAPMHTVALMGDAGTVYASPQALYLTNNDYAPMRAAILPLVAGGSVAREYTNVYKFSFRDDGAALTATGSVPGRLLDRFSMGEFKEHLRVATTTGFAGRGSGVAVNAVYVLAEEAGSLDTVGKVENIAPGEQIYSARFVAERGFLVTFKKIDPLFTLDLSDPAAPVVVGRLKVPGYSDYIHPMDKDHLLTIGKDALDVGDFAWYQGVQLSLFDVSNFADPRRVDAEIVGVRGTESEALFEPHAFNYFAPREMLAAPMNILEGAQRQPYDYGQPVFSGLCLYHVTTQGIDPLARIPLGSQGTSYYYYGNSWTRSVFIGDRVYAVTSDIVRTLALDHLDAAPLDLTLTEP